MGWTKRCKHYRHCTYSLHMVLDHPVPSIYPQSFLEWSRTSFEQSLAEFYTIHLEEHLEVASEMLEVGICSHSSLQNWPEWFSVQIWRLCWPEKMLKFTFVYFKPYLNSSSCVNGGIVVLENCIVVSHFGTFVFPSSPIWHVSILLLRKSGSAGNRTQELWICSQELWPLDHRGGQPVIIS
jgi:hypothetical protein